MTRIDRQSAFSGTKEVAAALSFDEGRLAAYLAAQVEAGVLAVEDCEIVAAQFMESSHAMLFKPIVFNFAPAPSPEQIDRVVGIAVSTFMAAYRVPRRS